MTRDKEVREGYCADVEQNRLILQEPEVIDARIPGFLSGDYLRSYYDPEQWIPTPDLLKVLLFAGHEDVDGLRTYTAGRISEFFRQNAPDRDTGNVCAAIELVERFMCGEVRRTGEPAIAHIYRDTLRQIDLMEGYNLQLRRNGQQQPFTSEIAELIVCATVLHDFMEDAFLHEDGISEYGASYIAHTDEDNGDTPGTIVFYRYLEQSENQEDTLLEEVPLTFTSRYLPIFRDTLLALKSDHIDSHELMEHLQAKVHAMKEESSLEKGHERILYDAAYMIKCIDRLDNNATYPYYKDEDGAFQAKPVDKLVAKAQENLLLFEKASHVLRSVSATSDTADTDPFYLKYDPTRWAKLVLLNTPTNLLYSPHEDGIGIPRIR